MQIVMYFLCVPLRLTIASVRQSDRIHLCLRAYGEEGGGGVVSTHGDVSMTKYNFANQITIS